MGNKNKNNLWLLQKYNNGDFFIYGWTTILAAKGYKILTAEQAEPYIKLAKMGKNNIQYVDDSEFIDSIKTHNEAATFIPVKPPVDGEEDDTVTKEIIKDAVQNGPQREVSEDEVRDINISQEDIQAAEMKYISGLQHKSTLESHLLEKYQCELPMGRLDTMKAMANSMLNDLAKENRLYFVDGGVKMK